VSYNTCCAASRTVPCSIVVCYCSAYVFTVLRYWDRGPQVAKSRDSWWSQETMTIIRNMHNLESPAILDF
jgi:hypothetical protein